MSILTNSTPKTYACMRYSKKSEAKSSELSEYLIEMFSSQYYLQNDV